MLRPLALLAVCAATAHADTVADLRAAAAKLRVTDGRGLAPVAPRTCAATTEAERSAITRRVLAWIDAAHPGETGPTVPDGQSFVITFGCRDATGAVVLDVSQDRESPGSRTRRNYLFRISTTLEVIAEDTSTSIEDWMEWADEGRIRLIAQLDLDGDRALDIVYSDHEHEGGATNTEDFLHVRYASGRRADSAQIVNLSDIELVNGRLVLAGSARDERTFYGCLGRDLRITPCPTSAALQRAADRHALASRYTYLTALPDRDQLAADLAMLRISGKRRAAFVAAAAETTAVDRVQREVAAFLEEAGLVEPALMSELIVQPHPESRAYLDDLAAKLGDTSCTPTPLTDADRAVASAWLDKQGARPGDTEMAPSACGPYGWVAWSSGPRRQALLGRDGTRILGFTYEPMMGELDLAHTDAWFTHDGAFVGVVIADMHLWVVSGNKAVIQSKGDVALYRADERSSETSIDVFVDGGTLWHATPAGREKLDRALVKDHEARRAAIALLQNTPPSRDAKYLAALQLLGANAVLIAECKKLP
jgi:hypothetical protein